MDAAKLQDDLRLSYLQAQQRFQEKQQRAMDEFLSEQREAFTRLSSTLSVCRDSPLSQQDGLGQRSAIVKRSDDDYEDDDEEQSSSEDDDEDRRLKSETPTASLDAARIFADVSKDEKIVATNNVQRFFLTILRSYCWHVFSVSLVLSMSLYLGIDADCRMKGALERLKNGKTLSELDELDMSHTHLLDDMQIYTCESYGWWNWINQSLFLLEMTVRLLGEWKSFFCGPNKKWNWFDGSLLLFLGLSDLPLHNTLVSHFLKFLRIGRWLRMIRIFQFVKELRRMVFSFAACLTSFGYASLFLACFIWWASIYLMETSLYYLSPESGQEFLGELCGDQKCVISLLRNFGGIDEAMKSLTYAITGGADWGDTVAPFWKMGVFGVLHGFTFIFFVVVVTLGLYNVLIGIFVRKANDFGFVSEDAALHEARLSATEIEEKMRGLFRELQRDGRKSVYLDDIKYSLGQPRIRAYFAYLGIDILRPQMMLDILDTNGSGDVDITEFVEGCKRLQGAAKPAEVATILKLTERIDAKLGCLIAGSSQGPVASERPPA